MPAHGYHFPLIEPFCRVSEADLALMRSILGRLRKPDLVIGTDEPYLYRWHIVPRNNLANVYLHVQVSSDPDRPLHDHPWDNTSVILSGGYNEVMGFAPTAPGHRADDYIRVAPIRKGEVRHRAAEVPHRLILPEAFAYTMTLFSTGPVRRDWGFWCKQGWRTHKVCLDMKDGRSIWIAPDRELA